MLGNYWCDDAPIRLRLKVGERQTLPVDLSIRNRGRVPHLVILPIAPQRVG